MSDIFQGYERVSDFSDGTDEILSPRLTPRQLSEIARFARAREFAPGEMLFEHGQPEAPFFVIEEGEVGFLDRRADGDRYFAKVSAGTFVGDISMFTGEPTIAACLAATPCRVLEMDRATLQRLVAQFPDVGDLLLRTMMARRAWLENHDYGSLQLIGSRWSRDTFRLRDFLTRNQVPFRWHDPATDEDSRVLLDSLSVTEDQTPVIIAAGKVFRRPQVADVASALGLLPALRGAQDPPYDLVVVGAGPGGLAAAVYGASEGLRTLVLDADSPGGQAGTSSKIENYLGFAAGISGNELARQAVLQARKFGATFSNPLAVETMAERDGVKTLSLSDGSEIRARAVVLAMGAEYRRLDALDIERYEGSGIYYAAGASEAVQCSGEEVIVVGGGNSAGQAAMFMSGYARKVHVVIRGDDLSHSMSQYLIERIEQSPNVQVLTRTKVAAVHGDGRLSQVTLIGPEGSFCVDASAVFVMIGAVPRTQWIARLGCVGLDGNGFVLTGGGRHGEAFDDLWRLERDPYFLETTCPGVFAVGDVRSGSVKRVASAVGEGSMAVKFVHEVFAG